MSLRSIVNDTNLSFAQAVEAAIVATRSGDALGGLRQARAAYARVARSSNAGDKAVGLANCFMGYSTFAAAALVNIHDFAVLPGHRGAGIGKALMAAIEAEALKRGACKITLEVLSGNPARRLYQREGFGDYQLDPTTGHALFWQKRLT